MHERWSFELPLSYSLGCHLSFKTRGSARAICVAALAERADIIVCISTAESKRNNMVHFLSATLDTHLRTVTAVWFGSKPTMALLGPDAPTCALDLGPLRTMTLRIAFNMPARRLTSRCPFCQVYTRISH